MHDITDLPHSRAAGILPVRRHLCSSVAHLWLPLLIPLITFLPSVLIHSAIGIRHSAIASPSFQAPFTVKTGSLGGRNRVISGSFRGRFGVVWGSFWGRFGVVWGSIWGRFLHRSNSIPPGRPCTYAPPHEKTPPAHSRSASHTFPASPLLLQFPPCTSSSSKAFTGRRSHPSPSADQSSCSPPAWPSRSPWRWRRRGSVAASGTPRSARSPPTG